MTNSIVQYVLLRSDLYKELGWSIGALVAQACHASTAVLHLYKNTMKYLNDFDNMHKVVLDIPKNSIDHKLWIEQPKYIPTCLAIKPYPKDIVKKYVGKFQLYKDTITT
ncbi:hypothetical protein K1T71_006224 [Dendrolimus kikuchii]|uniref:Uncharacterized protein n=1 Tax=Dendrolimus kikuchii TaxID=765133 RepID=A0ACC1D3L6_9NEOP|nr:hypothetical protein K1T71_006224 [Dendrolimus kikuchii]